MGCCSAAISVCHLRSSTTTDHFTVVLNNNQPCFNSNEMERYFFKKIRRQELSRECLNKTKLIFNQMQVAYIVYKRLKQTIFAKCRTRRPCYVPSCSGRSSWQRDMNVMYNYVEKYDVRLRVPTGSLCSPDLPWLLQRVSEGRQSTWDDSVKHHHHQWCRLNYSKAHVDSGTVYIFSLLFHFPPLLTVPLEVGLLNPARGSGGLQ